MRLPCENSRTPLTAPLAALTSIELRQDDPLPWGRARPCRELRLKPEAYENCVDRRIDAYE